MSIPVLVAWSGGKDSLMALWKLPSEYEVVALVTNIQASEERISVHGVRRELLDRQAAALGLPLHIVELPDAPSNAEYEARVEAVFAPFRERGITHVVYGDLFLPDVREYRDAHLQRMGMQGVYPLWEQDTRALIQEFIAAGFKTVVTAVDTTQLDASFVGRELDMAFVRDLLPGIDPCGENGEFHTFVYAGPLFRQPVAFTIGKTFWKDDRFCYCDLLP